MSQPPLSPLNTAVTCVAPQQQTLRAVPCVPCRAVPCPPTQVVATADINLPVSLMGIMMSLMDEFVEAGDKGAAPVSGTEAPPTCR